MSPINERRTLLTQLWFMYDACIQIPHDPKEVSFFDVFAAVFLWVSKLEIGQPKTLCDIMRSTRNLIVQLASRVMF